MSFRDVDFCFTLRIVTGDLKGCEGLTIREHSAEEYKRYVALYFEALNSSSPVYQFLCVFKILDSLIARNKRRDKKTSADRNTCVLLLRIPTEDFELVSFLRPLFGQETDAIVADGLNSARDKRVSFIIQSNLRPLRDRIAQYLLNDEMDVDWAERLATTEVRAWLPTARVVCHLLLRYEFPSNFDLVPTMGS